MATNEIEQEQTLKARGARIARAIARRCVPLAYGQPVTACTLERTSTGHYQLQVLYRLEPEEQYEAIIELTLVVARELHPDAEDEVLITAVLLSEKDEGAEESAAADSDDLESVRLPEGTRFYFGEAQDGSAAQNSSLT